MKHLFPDIQVLTILLIILVVLLLPFIYKRIMMLFHYLKPYRHDMRMEQWLRHLEAPPVGSNSESIMRELAGKQVLRKRARSNVIRDAQMRVYLNLQSVRRQLTRTPARTISMIPASLWIFDNYNLLYREIKKFQGAGNLHELLRLPVLETGDKKGCPRIYLIAREIIAAANNHPQEATIINLINAYQMEKQLNSRELWSMGSVMSLCLLEKIVDEAVFLIQDIQIKMQADQAADRIAAAMHSDVRDITELLKKEIDRNKFKDEKFITHFFFRLRNIPVDDTEVVRWFSRMNGLEMDAYHLLIDEMITKERQYEAVEESRISSLIISLKEIGELNWDETFKKVSKVEAELELDPARIYSAMDSVTRGRYRHEVERLAEKYKLQETEVAARAVELASTSPADSVLEMPDHIGTYLVGSGCSLLKALLENRPLIRPFHPRNKRNRLRGTIYLVGIFGITAAMLIMIYIVAGTVLIHRPVPAAILFIQFLLLAVGFSILVVHTAFTRMVHPEPQLSMDFSEGIPDDFRTFVVMPVIIGSASKAQTYASRLEKYYLANKQDNLYFAILGDLKDAQDKVLPEDSAVLDAAAEAIQKLNEKYPGSSVRFSLFLRERLWNEYEKCWMCWERKRGKLEEFNALLSGEEGLGFEIRVGSPELFSSFRFVITLDADTDLIRESAGQLVGIMAHPLNQAVIDDKSNRIISGYAIAQPEICARVNDSGASFFTRLSAGESGIDRYATVISDIYQDTFGEGIFVGKGIYDFRVMHRLLRGAISSNTVLSHDLLESSLTRCAFASGIRALDTTPPNFAAFARRDHRWIRGDWQLLPWIFHRSQINWLSRWKMIDNLRRSLTSTASVIAIIVNVIFFPQYVWLWVPFVLLGDAWRFIFFLYGIGKQKFLNSSVHIAWKILYEQFMTMFLQTVFSLILLPFNASLSLDAIFRTLFRVFFSHRNLLEWQSSETDEKNLPDTLGSYIWMMFPAEFPAFILAAVTFLLVDSPFAVLLYALACAWMLSPFVAWITSRTRTISTSRKFKPEDTLELRLLARKTWRFFEDFATAENNWLCPDNLQQFPGPKLSDKTSPTNIGMQLLAALSACDLGFISLRALVSQCEAVMLTLRRMQKWNGHLFNWYNVKTLELLMPQYVSTVDSGNFLAHLITLKNGLLDLAERSLFPDEMLLGLGDTLAAAGVSRESLKGSFSSQKDRETLLDFLRTTAAEQQLDSYWQQRIAQAANSLETEMHELAGPDGLIPDLSLNDLAESGQAAAVMILNSIRSISMEIDTVVGHADFEKLYDGRHNLFYIGYSVSNQRADSGLYDLLASEARVTSFLAIAKGDITQKNWFALGRPLTLVKGVPALVSWSGTMFEYLMPNIIMKMPRGTILNRSCTAAVKCQIMHGKRQKIPWGISESQYFTFDTDSNYQYSAFGMQYLRLQSSMKPARVVAPYATVLALDIAPEAAVKNLRQLVKVGAGGTYGLFESLDFNKPDAGRLKQYSLVQSFMAHHQGMILASINNSLHENILQERFHDEAMINAASILLEETRSAVLISLARRGYSINIELEDFEDEQFESRYCNTVNSQTPVAHVLSNNHYLLMLTSCGQGFSRCDDIMINTWRPETTSLSYGNFVYIRNLASDQIWSNTYCPTFAKPDEYSAIFSADKVEYKRRDGLISTNTAVVLSPFENYEIRRVTLTNHSDLDAEIELTSYIEVVDDFYLAEAMHPAFNKLFLELEYVSERNMLIAGRRKRSEDDTFGKIMHMVWSESKFVRTVEYETDRRSFIGRDGTKAMPQVLKTHLPLSGRAGFSLDPIMSLRCIVSVPANRSVAVSFITGYCTTRAEVHKLSYELRKTLWSEDIFRQALTSSRLEMKYLNINSQQLNAIQSLVGPLFYPTRAYRDQQDKIIRNVRGQSSLWRFGISGDYPVILLRVKDKGDLPVIRDALLAYEFLHLQTVHVDLVIVNEEDQDYSQSLQQAIMELTGTTKVYNSTKQKPSLFILRRFLISDEESDLLSTVARIVIRRQTGIYIPRTEISAVNKDLSLQSIPLPAGDSILPGSNVDTSFIPPVPLEYFNGLGGFAADGREYEMWLGTGRKTPAPWINVIAGESFGFHVSETGAGYTWAVNSRENKLTSWSNDPTLDPASEAVYIKDHENGAVTSPASLRPGRGQGYQVRHGFGYSVFSHAELEIEQSMTLFAAVDDPVKIWLINIRDHSGRNRELSVTLYAEWVLGNLREQTAPYIVTQYDALTGMFSAKNVYAECEQQHPAFLFSSETITSYTGDRKGFLGVGRSICYPSGLAEEQLSGETGACFDPCGAIQMEFSLAAGASKTIVLGLGQADNIDKANALVQKYRSLQTARNELERVHDYWNSILTRVHIKTPDRAMDILHNGWLVYQIISCRLHARSAFYQCGGAFGFRDQLQDALSLLDVDPGFAQRQIILCCAHQFVEGDVQHWWQPDTGIGVRTRISDDLLWLPCVLSAYVEHTGKPDILLEKITYIQGEILAAGQPEKMFLPHQSDKSENVYQHCLRAIERSGQFGVNGLPLMGAGDWNDGMNRVGIEGKGESVWLGWFYYYVVKKFSAVCLLMNDQDSFDRLISLAESVRLQIEKTAWDGRWYLRGFFDNGSPLGSRSNEECQIDSISQSWAVLSGGGDTNRTAMALDSAKHYLVHQGEGVIQLLTPPFNKSMPDPGYIKGYYPGIRENGGQYTHAALWLAMANAKAGRGADAFELLKMLNPILITSTVKDIARYEKEPYVMSADVYMGDPYTGKSGWSWYTGSAGWMYQGLLHSFLGINRRGERLHIEPAFPAVYNSWQIEYYYGAALYRVRFVNDSGHGTRVAAITVDGVSADGGSFLMHDDMSVHEVVVTLSPDT